MKNLNIILCESPAQREAFQAKANELLNDIKWLVATGNAMSNHVPPSIKTSISKVERNSVFLEDLYAPTQTLEEILKQIPRATMGVDVQKNMAWCHAPGTFFPYYFGTTFLEAATKALEEYKKLKP